MSHRLFCRAALAIVAAVTVVSYTVGFPGTALPDGAVAALTLAPGAASVAALLLLPALDRGWAYAAGALVLLATPGITAAAAAALVAPTASLTTIMHDAEAMAAAFAVAERNFAPSFVASAVLLLGVLFVAPRAAQALAIAAQAVLVILSMCVPITSMKLAHVSSRSAPCGVVIQTAQQYHTEQSLRILLLSLSSSSFIFTAMLLAKVCRATRVARFSNAATAVIVPVLLFVVHDRSARQAPADALDALRVAALGSPMLLGLSVLEVLRVLRVVVVTVVLPLLSVTLLTSHDSDCGGDDSDSDDNNDDETKQCEAAVEKQRLIEVV